MANLHPTTSPAEEWEEWMDWEKMSNSTGQNESSGTTRTSLDESKQQPSPQTSTASEISTNNSRKRKSSSDIHELPTNLKKPNVERGSVASKSHSIVEKRYRTNLNQKISELANRIPNLKEEPTAARSAQPSTTLKHNKATVLGEAIAYINQLERRNRLLEQGHAALQQQLAEKETLEPSIVEKDTRDEVRPAKVDEASTDELPRSDAAHPKPAQGLIKVPEEWKRLWRGELKPYCSEKCHDDGPEDEDDMLSRTKIMKGKHVRRLMVGSLAGLMVVDGIQGSQKGQSNERGLFAVPLLRHVSHPSQIPLHFRIAPLQSHLGQLHQSHLSLMLRGFLVFAVLGLMLFIYLFTSRPPPRKARTMTNAQPAPSLASPLEVRQRAFLTALQTIWVPRHHALPEMLALNVETAAYVVRQLLGWQMYSWVTGRTEEEEIARVRAWDIATDAQLSGGDPEISKSRLVLSLWASGTLPSSPARLMLKALHIRILFWQPSSIEWITRLFHHVAEKLASWQWNKACKLQQRLDEQDVTQDGNETLTEHLRALLACSADDVLDGEMVQRAHNLAWNTSGSQRDCSESMTEDTAMRGPLDALAARYSDILLTRILRQVIEDDKAEASDDRPDQLEQAEYTAPPGSLTKMKALVAGTVLCRSELNRPLLRLRRILGPSTLSNNDELELANTQSLDAHVQDFPEADATDIMTCCSCVRIKQQLSHPSHKPTHLVDSLDRLSIQYEQHGAWGLLGWTALSHTIVHAQRNGFGKLLGPAIQRSVESLDKYKDLDFEIRTGLIRTLLNLVEEGPATVREGRRRCSAASNDTGYASMSDVEMDETCEC